MDRSSPPVPTVRGARDFDIAPTVLSLLGLDVPGHLDGRAVSELIASEPSASGIAPKSVEAVRSAP